jgi:Arc/MetJ-type ribon-helix-helix transcriptional regulator
MIILMPNERVTVTLPADVVEDIDGLERNRSKFIKEAVRREIKRRRRERLRRSLQHPHLESRELAEVGLTNGRGVSLMRMWRNSSI